MAPHGLRHTNFLPNPESSAPEPSRCCICSCTASLCLAVPSQCNTRNHIEQRTNKVQSRKGKCDKWYNCSDGTTQRLTKVLLCSALRSTPNGHGTRGGWGQTGVTMPAATKSMAVAPRCTASKGGHRIAKLSSLGWTIVKAKKGKYMKGKAQGEAGDQSANNRKWRCAARIVCGKCAIELRLEAPGGLG